MNIIHNKFKKRQTKEETRQFAVAVLFAGIGIFLGSVSQNYGDMRRAEQAALAAEKRAAELAEKNQAADEEKMMENHTAKISIMPQKKLEIASSPPPYQAEPDKLNLAYLYPEGADTEDIINSYAGQVFEELMVMDSEWLADLYELADVSPAVMASRLGKPVHSIKGNYNPKDDKHQPDDPETWIIHDWKKIHVNFVDGNGNALSRFSNVKDILAMASVYTYYQNWMDAELFSDYSRQLWKDSHGYALRISDIYYCDGCLSKTEEELVREAEELELLEEAVNKTEEANEIINETAASELSPQTIDVNAVNESEIQQELPEPVFEPAQDLAETITETTASELFSQTIDVNTVNESEIQQELPESVSEPTENIAETITETDANGLSLQITDATPASFSDAQKISKTSSDEIFPEEEQEHLHCPGHVDLFIQVKILGLQEKNGLFSKDSMGNADNLTTEETPSWTGWTEENITSVHAISSQDWFADYGLSVSSICLSNPLTNQEIEEYMNQLPSDLSETRRTIIHFALSSVGKVPYYWGGKASASGYEGNNFGALISADNRGRILRGLDCSGWVSWVYWSATGQKLAGESTSSLALCGEKISRSQLKPGDIIVRTGTSAHVVMFLSWSADGKMNVIHESSAPVNNVTIKTMDAPWPHYRKLVD